MRTGTEIAEKKNAGREAPEEIAAGSGKNKKGNGENGETIEGDRTSFTSQFV